MAITWDILNFTRELSNQGLARTNVVTQIHWLARKDDDSSSLFVKRQGVVDLEAASNDNFVAYEDITKDLAFTWLYAKIDKAAIETELEYKLTVLKNPPTQDGVPWIIED